MGLPLGSFASGGRNIDKEIHLIGPAIGQARSIGVPPRALAKRRGPSRHRAAGSGLLAANAAAPQCRRSRPIAVRLHATARQRNGPGIAPRRRVIQNLQSEDCDRLGQTVYTATNQTAPSARGFPGGRASRPADRLSILFKAEPANDGGLRPAEGDDHLVLWDFHDLLFHARSTEGRHANPLGGLYPYAGVISPLPAVRPRWPGKKIDLGKFSVAHSEAISPAAKLLLERHSTRSFDDQRPITLAELARFLDSTARVRGRLKSRLDLDDGGPVVTYAVRPYPSGGGCYELELYLAVDKCEGLARGFYHYDADRHALVPIDVRSMSSRHC